MRKWVIFTLFLISGCSSNNLVSTKEMPSPYEWSSCYEIESMPGFYKNVPDVIRCENTREFCYFSSVYGGYSISCLKREGE